MTAISFITSLYRSEEHLGRFLRYREALDEALSAHGIEAEFVIVPNDATPQEEALLAPLSQHERVRVVHTAREPLYASWNRGIAHTQSPVLGFWNVDDRRDAGAILEALACFRIGYDLVDTPFEVYEGGRRRYTRPPAFNPRFLSPKHQTGPFFMFTRQLYEQTGAFNGRFRICGDFEWTSRAPVRQCRYAHTRASGGDFVMHNENLSGGNNENLWIEFNTVLLWRGAYQHLRPVAPERMREIWQAWGHTGATLPDAVANWLWGEGAEARYQAHKRWRRRPRLWRKIRLWASVRLNMPHPERDFQPPGVQP